LKGLSWLLIVPLALSACTGTRLREPATGTQTAYAERAGRLGQIRSWALSGRISLDDGKEGGSGSLRWGVGPRTSELDFHGAMGRGAWHLSISPELVVLREANGERQEADDVDELVRQRLGWPVPVAALGWWVRGLVAPGDVDSVQLDRRGRPVRLAQDGWRVKFERYTTGEGESLPLRLDARRGQYRVKLSVRRWQMGDEDAQGG